MHQDDGFRFHAQFAMLRQDVKLMHPVAEVIEVGGGFGEGSVVMRNDTQLCVSSWRGRRRSSL